MPRSHIDNALKKQSPIQLNKEHEDDMTKIKENNVKLTSRG